MKYQANPVIVDAWKIDRVVPNEDGDGYTLVAANADGSAGIQIIRASADMCARMTPKIGDYVVKQADGYTYLNPADVFLRKYSPVKEAEIFGIGKAVKEMQNGARVCRSGWNGKGMWLALQVPDAHSKMGNPYVYIRSVDGKLVPWQASQTDLLAMDWQIVSA